MGSVFRKTKHSLVFVFWAILVLSISFPATSFGQDRKADKKKKTEKKIVPRSPLKASLWAIIPGGGQIYNHKYWKVPIVWAGFAVIGYSAAFSTRQYKTFRDAYSCKVNNPDCTDPLAKYPANTLQIYRDYYRRNMQLSYIIMGGWYILQMIDANVDAQFTHWNVSNNLSMDVYPVLKRPAQRNQTPAYNGIALRLNF